MRMDEKCHLLNELVKPFGYSYILAQDIFSTRVDAWQRDFGYCALYDKAAAGFGMVFDCLPVYFDYQGRTWLIEFWKGQYGINTGCEIGVYHADGIVGKDQLDRTFFHCVENKDMQRLSFCLSGKGHEIARLNGEHWWLTAFSTGVFSKPSELAMDIHMTLADHEMAHAFVKGYMEAGCDRCGIRISGKRIQFSFTKGTQKRKFHEKIQAFFAQLCNRFCCRIFRLVTRPFRTTLDRVLYLYLYLPSAFRKIFRQKKRLKDKINTTHENV